MAPKPRILVADDEAHNRSLMEALLAPQGYEVLFARDGAEAVALAAEASPDVILLDVMMPRMDGIEAARRIKSNEVTRIIPIVMVTSLTDVEDRVRAMEAGADDFLSKPVDKTELRARVKSLLTVKAYSDHLLHYQRELETEVARQTAELRRAFQQVRAASLDTILRLARAAEYKDEDTGAHIQRMSRYTAALARAMGFDEGKVDEMLYASPMHDVGKIAVPDDILLKEGNLNDEEWAVMRRHTVVGAGILEGSENSVLQCAETIALTHHEKWDGTGYPRRLRGEAIPVAGRITAVADVFDALTSVRPYKSALPVDEAVEMLRTQRERHFDPAAVDAFLAILDEILGIKAAQRRDNKTPY